jgi:hypothetical protein
MKPKNNFFLQKRKDCWKARKCRNDLMLQPAVFFLGSIFLNQKSHFGQSDILEAAIANKLDEINRTLQFNA